MSSLGGSTDTGNSIVPGVPGAGNVDRWSTYQAISNIDGGGYSLINTNIDLCNDTIENIDIVNATLTGTTTLDSGHVFSGTLAAANDITTSGDVHIEPGGSLYVGGPTTTTDGFRFHYDSITNAGYIDYNGPNAMNFRTNDLNGGTTRMSIAEDGEVDIAGNLVVNGTITNPTSISSTGTITGGNISASGFGTITTLGDMGCANLTATAAVSAQQLTSAGNLTITSSGGFVDFTSVRVSGTLGESGASSSRIFTEKSSVKWLGTAASAEDVNGLTFVAPNDTSRAFVFIGQRDSATPSSMGLASKNAYSSTIVGFAPSAISGIEKWSFTGKHQAQYTGILNDNHKGMVVESTGNIVGLNEKPEYGINQANPDYSNATPIVRLCSTRASKAVIGVIKEITDLPDTTTGDLVISWDENGYAKGDKRVQVNAIGEGLIWVANTNGNIAIGDLVHSSNEAGYAEKADDDIIRSSTIAKITAPCDFIQEQVSKKKILTDDEGQNVLDSQGRLIWVNDTQQQNKYVMRVLPNGRKACLLPCVYYCG